MIEDLLAWFGQAYGFIHAPLGQGLILTGALLTIVGAVGVLRFPDFYTRLHAASVTDTAGATLMLVGMALISPTGWVALKLLFIWLFLFLTSPASSHALANAAYTAGMEPRTGPGAGHGPGGVS